MKYAIYTIVLLLTAPLLVMAQEAGREQLPTRGFYINPAFSLEAESVHRNFFNWLGRAMKTDNPSAFTMLGEEAYPSFFYTWGVEAGTIRDRRTVGIQLKYGQNSMDEEFRANRSIEGDREVRSMFVGGLSLRRWLLAPIRDSNIQGNIGLGTSLEYKRFFGDEFVRQTNGANFETTSFAINGVSLETSLIFELGFKTSERTTFLLHYQIIALHFSSTGIGGTALQIGGTLNFW